MIAMPASCVVVHIVGILLRLIVIRMRESMQHGTLSQTERPDGLLLSFLQLGGHIAVLELLIIYLRSLGRTVRSVEIIGVAYLHLTAVACDDFTVLVAHCKVDF